MWAADVVNGDAAVLRIGNGQTRRTFMPPVLVYQIEFANNIDLHPNVDTQDWGDMVLGGSSVGALDRSFDDVGLTLRATRYAELGPTHMPEHDLPSHVVHTTYKLAPGSLPKATEGVSNAVYVVLPPRKLPRETRFTLHVEFDSPTANPEGTTAAPALPWAVALRVKIDPGNATDLPTDHRIDVTCQFRQDGVKLNDPDKAEDDAKNPYNKTRDLLGPFHYADFQFGTARAQFSLDFVYCGTQAGPRPTLQHHVGEKLGYAVGCGLLDIQTVPNASNPIATELGDRRVFSSTKLSTPDTASIGALGIGVGTVNYVGTMSARLKRFSVAMETDQI